MSAAMVEVHLFAAARAAVGSSVLLVSPASIDGILADIEARHPGFAVVRPRCSVLIDGIAVHGKLDEVLATAGSRVDVLPPFAGG